MIWISVLIIVIYQLYYLHYICCMIHYMLEPTRPPRPYGSPSRGVSGNDVERAADQLLRAGERPTVEKVRSTLGTGSPNTINPLLDAWWKRLSSRLDAGPAALHRLPENVAHVAESLWLQALEEGRRRALLELGADRRAADQAKDGYEVRSHVLSLREGELDSRLRERERAHAELEAQLRTLTTLLKKEQRTRELQAKRIQELEAALDQGRQLKRPPLPIVTVKRSKRAATPVPARQRKLAKKAKQRRPVSKSARRNKR